jgi:WD40 repeat protein
LSIWTFPDGKFVRTVGGKPVAISANWSLLAVEGSLIDLNSGATLLKTPNLVRGRPACFTPDSRHLVMALTSWVKHRGPKQIKVISTRDTSEVSSFCSRYTTALAVSPDNTTLASGHWDNVTLWNLGTGERTALLRGFDRYVYGLAFSADGRLLAAGTDTGFLQLWEVATHRHLWSLQVGWGYVSNPAFSPDGRVVAAGTYADGTLSLVDVSTGKAVSQIRVSMFGCGSVSFSPDGRYLIVPSNGGQIAPGRFDTGGTIRVYELNVARSAGAPTQQ